MTEEERELLPKWAQKVLVWSLFGSTVAGAILGAVKLVRPLFKESKSALQAQKHAGKKELSAQRHRERMEEEKLKTENNIRKMERRAELGFNLGGSQSAVPDSLWHSCLYDGNDKESNDDVLKLLPDIISEGKKKGAIKWFVDTPLQIGGISLVYSSGGNGKSAVLFQMLCNAYWGHGSNLTSPDKQWADYKAKPEIILYDSELTDWEFSNRIKLPIEQIPPFMTKLYSRFEGYKNLLTRIDNDIFQAIKSNVSDSDYIVAIDNITTAVGSLNHKSIDAFANGLREIQRCVAKEFGASVTFIIILHTKENKKGNSLKDIAGSAEWGRIATEAISFVETKDPDVKILRNVKCRNGKDKIDCYVRKVEDPYFHFECDSELNIKECGSEHPFQPDVRGNTLSACDSPSVVRGIRLLSSGGVSSRDIGNRYGISHTEVQRIIHETT